jgi:hypothetical protein
VAVLSVPPLVAMALIIDPLLDATRATTQREVVLLAVEGVRWLTFGLALDWMVPGAAAEQAAEGDAVPQPPLPREAVPPALQGMPMVTTTTAIVSPAARPEPAASPVAPHHC